MSASHLSPIDLDMLVLGLTPEHRRTDERQGHVAGCPTCAHAKQQRLADQQAFMQSGYGRGLARIQFLKRAPRRRWHLVLASLAAPALVALAIVASARGYLARPSPVPDSHESAFGIKGPGGLRLFARRGESVFPVDEGQRMMPGDALRFVLEPTAYPYLLIASVDGDGRASVYFPFDGEASAHVPTGSALEAPAGSVILDQSQGPERIFAIWSEEAVSSNVVVTALSQLGSKGHQAIRETTALGLPATFEQSILIEKSRGF